MVKFNLFSNENKNNSGSNNQGGLGEVLGVTENESMFPSLTYTQRLYGFVFCTILGYVITLASLGSFFMLFTGKPAKFAITYSLGNIIALSATMFLIGPKRQLKNMTNKDRLYTSIIYISSMIGTLVFALVVKIAILVLICIIIQFCSFVWYTASYIPFARSLLKSIGSKIAKAIKK